MIRNISFMDIFGPDIMASHEYFVSGASISYKTKPPEHNVVWLPHNGTIVKCDVIALVYDGAGIIDRLPGYFTRSMEDMIIVDDPERTLGENAANKIRVSNIHTVRGAKFTCITLNTDTEVKSLNSKYVCRDTWPD